MKQITLVSVTVLWIVIAGFLPSESQADKRIVCYFASWATYRSGEGAFDVESIDPNLCTHLVYAFAGLGTDGKFKVLDEYNDLEENWGKGAMKRFNALKTQNPALKTLLAIGGWNDGSEQYSAMVSSAASRRVFIDSVTPFLLAQGFDGLDFDWEYPTERGGKPEDRENFDLLLGELRSEFNNHGLLLTAAIGADQGLIEKAYNVANMGIHLDFINVMTFDYHSAGSEAFVHHHSPLYAHEEDAAHYTNPRNIDHTMKFLVASGAPSEKLNIALATYGHGWNLENADVNEVYSTAYQAISAGPILGVGGSWAYKHICKVIPANQWNIVRLDSLSAPYAHKNLEWMGYDDPQSVNTKAQYVLDNNFGGAMVWAIDTDDFAGNCHGEPFPLISAFRRAVNGGGRSRHI